LSVTILDPRSMVPPCRPSRWPQHVPATRCSTRSRLAHRADCAEWRFERGVWPERGAVAPCERLVGAPRQLHSRCCAVARSSGRVRDRRRGLDALIIGVIARRRWGSGSATSTGRARRGGHALRHPPRGRHDAGRSVGERRGHHLVPGDIVHWGRFDRPGRCAPPAREQPRVRRVDPDRRIVPAEKSADPVASGAPLAELSSCLFMGRSSMKERPTPWWWPPAPRRSSGASPWGSASTIPRPSSSSASAALGTAGQGRRRAQHHDLRDQRRLGSSSHRRRALLPRRRSWHHPQLPAVVSTSLATGSRRLAEKKVLVKRLVCIEDLATSTCCSPTRPGPSPTATSASNGQSAPPRRER